MFKIEKGVEMGMDVRRRVGPPKYPLDEMEVGDSFFIQPEYVERVRAAVARRKTWDREARFSVAKNPAGEYRCWRVE